MKISFGARLLL